MSILSRVFGKNNDARDGVRPLWRRVIELARDPGWYARGGLCDTVNGRFDAITLILALVLLRMEREEALVGSCARLTELFVEDMDGQLRQAGVGDLVVGKRMGKLMGALGGRIGALREALPQGAAALGPVLARNLTLVANVDLAALAAMVLALASQLDRTRGEDLLAGRFAR